MLGAFLICLLIAVGLAFSFIGACRNEKPRAFSIIGFVLNSLWLLFPIVGIGAGLLFSLL